MQVPWQLFQLISELKELITQLSDFQIHHNYREANSTADLLAKWSHKVDDNQHYYVYQQLPIAVKGAYLMDKMGLINFRRRKLKRVKKPP